GLSVDRGGGRRTDGRLGGFSRNWPRRPRPPARSSKVAGCNHAAADSDSKLTRSRRCRGRVSVGSLPPPRLAGSGEGAGSGDERAAVLLECLAARLRHRDDAHADAELAELFMTGGHAIEIAIDGRLVEHAVAHRGHDL